MARSFVLFDRLNFVVRDLHARRMTQLERSLAVPMDTCVLVQVDRRSPAMCPNTWLTVYMASQKPVGIGVVSGAGQGRAGPPFSEQLLWFHLTFNSRQRDHIPGWHEGTKSFSKRSNLRVLAP